MEDVTVHIEDHSAEVLEAMRNAIERGAMAIGEKAVTYAKDNITAQGAAVRAWYEGKGITGKALEIAMRGSSAEIEVLELEDGKIKDPLEVIHNRLFRLAS